jgi:hypothetical protein
MTDTPEDRKNKGKWWWERVETPGCVPEWTLRGTERVLCRFWTDEYVLPEAELIADAKETAAQRDALREALRPFANFACDCGECYNCKALAAIELCGVKQ